MSVDRPLETWIASLVAAADLDPLLAGGRIRQMVGARSARIGLDDEQVVVRFEDDELVFDDIASMLDGEGWTTSAVVLGILGATIEAGHAIESGLIQVVGDTDAVVRLFGVVELLLDASSRVPELRDLADEFIESRAGVAPVVADTRRASSSELALLNRLGVGG